MAVFSKPASPVTFSSAAFGANNTPAPDSYYHFDEGSGTTLENIGKDAGSYDCTINGADWGTDDGSAILTAVSANGDYVTAAIPGITAYPFTLAAYVKKVITGTGGTVISVGDGSVNNVYYSISDASTDRIGVNASNTTLDNTLAADATDSNILNVWHLVVAAFVSATERNIYVKDVAGNEASGTGTVSTTFNAASDTMNFFARAAGNQGAPDDAAIAGAMVWKGVALSSAQIFTDLWNSGGWAPFVTTSSSSAAVVLKRNRGY